MKAQNTLDVRIIEPKLKHPSIFQGFDKLSKGEVLTIINDHDPLPLYYQFNAERPELFHWEYTEKGPETWRVEIKKIKEQQQTVADILLENPKAATVFKKFRIDYCCKGSKLFEEACEEAGFDPEELKKQIEEATEAPQSNMRAQEWSLDFLADYIVNNHHQYVKSTSPDLLALSEKVKNVHGKQHPELIEVDKLLNIIVKDLMAHMEKEEKMLFPAIKNIVGGNQKSNPFDSISEPIDLMENEHIEAGDDFEKVYKLTDGYTIPQDGCTSYRLLFEMIKGFENDLNQHIHLENNILFPKAIKLEENIN